MGDVLEGLPQAHDAHTHDMSHTWMSPGGLPSMLSGSHRACLSNWKGKGVD